MVGPVSAGECKPDLKTFKFNSKQTHMTHAEQMLELSQPIVFGLCLWDLE